jgi:hypothetical protein
VVDPLRGVVAVRAVVAEGVGVGRFGSPAKAMTNRSGRGVTGPTAYSTCSVPSGWRIGPTYVLDKGTVVLEGDSQQVREDPKLYFYLAP